jgi:hypothetical protein
MINQQNIRVEKRYTTAKLNTGELTTYCSSEGTVADYECPICKKWVEVRGLTEHILIKYGCKDCRPPVQED